jgi:hypothetical protein
MHRSLSQFAVVVAALLAGSAWGFQKGAETRSTYKDTVHGFTIEIPKFPGSGRKVPGVVFTATGPPVGKFAPNINIVIQDTATTTKGFIDQTVEQFKQLGMELHGRKILKVAGRDAVEFDYQGSFNGGEDLRFLALAVIEKDRVVLVTCTAPAAAFDASEADYRACLKSLKLD